VCAIALLAQSFIRPAIVLVLHGCHGDDEMMVLDEDVGASSTTIKPQCGTLRTHKKEEKKRGVKRDAIIACWMMMIIITIMDASHST